MAATIEAHGLKKRYGSTTALDGLDLVAERGQVVAVLGPNGAGKTTFVRAVATLLRPDEGTLRVAGHDVREDPAAVRRLIGLVQILGREEDVGALIDEVADRVPELDAAPRVQAGRGLIQQQQTRRPDQARAEVELATHPSRVCTHQTIGGFGETHPLEDERRVLLRGAFVLTEQARHHL